MIRYPITLDELKKRIESAEQGGHPGWSARAEALTRKFDSAGKYLDSESSIWSEIKNVFINLQHRKCAFCERHLEAKKEYDVEHFRPKSSVKRWPVSKDLLAAGVVVRQSATPTPKEAGYHLLTYNLQNYSVACATCNSVLKSDYFPIKGTRQSGGDAPITLLTAEEPFLLFPVGNFDEDPEDIITFHGVSPQAKPPRGTHAHHRALLTITFFKLDDLNKRRELFRGRADVIQKMGLAFQRLEDRNLPLDKKARCERIIAYHKSAAAPYTSCGRSYARLWQQDPASAERVWEDAVDILDKISPIPPSQT